MTKLEFHALCGEFLLPPALVLENELVRKALFDRDTDKVRTLLVNEF